MRLIYILALSSLFIWSCDGLEPELDQAISDDDFWNDKDFTQAALANVYNELPSYYDAQYGDFLDCATDNAVTNDYSSSLITMATGGWQPANNPIDSWESSYKQIRTLNELISRIGDIPLSNDSANNVNLTKRVKGEIYFLRAWFQFDLLSKYSGIDESGSLKGFPIITQPMSVEQSESLERNSFDQCVDQILSDIDDALIYLSASQYSGADISLGSSQVGRAYKLPALSLKSRVLLYAASPAYSRYKSQTQKQQLWEAAAKAAKVAMDEIGSLPFLSSNGSWLIDPNHREIIWRSFQGEGNFPEDENFMPSLWGNGRTNPSQQLVDAFPMKDGYPTNLSPTYDASNPYANRDSRFYLTVVYNNAPFGSSVAKIFEGGKDYESTEHSRATRTGYYLRKFIDPNVVVTPGDGQTTTRHYYAFFRCAEMWLNYAEAANEAWGPYGDDLGLGKTARAALAELRLRSGISIVDPYLIQMANEGIDTFRKLVQNERRVELCFENHRFYDVRRWLLPVSELSQDVEGVRTTMNADSTFTYQYDVRVESRDFKDHMYYGPLPDQAVYGAKNPLSQNIGW